jgi:hypothetical protein
MEVTTAWLGDPPAGGKQPSEAKTEGFSAMSVHWLNLNKSYMSRRLKNAGWKHISRDTSFRES